MSPLLPAATDADAAAGAELGQHYAVLGGSSSTGADDVVPCAATPQAGSSSSSSSSSSAGHPRRKPRAAADAAAAFDEEKGDDDVIAGYTRGGQAFTSIDSPPSSTPSSSSTAAAAAALLTSSPDPSALLHDATAADCFGHGLGAVLQDEVSGLAYRFHRLLAPPHLATGARVCLASVVGDEGEAEEEQEQRLACVKVLPKAYLLARGPLPPPYGPYPAPGSALPVGEIGAQLLLASPKPSSSSSSAGNPRTITGCGDCSTDLNNHHHNGHKEPPILPLLAAVDGACTLCLVYPYSPLGDLFGRVASTAEAGLPEAEARRCFVQIARGLLALQQRGLTHGDVSLENVLLLPTTASTSTPSSDDDDDDDGSEHLDNPSYACALIDLEMARRLLPPAAPPSHATTAATAAGHPVGDDDDLAFAGGGMKPSYIPPELAHPPSASAARHAPCMDWRAVDAFALGVCLYMLLTGHPLFMSPDDAAAQHVYKEGPASLLQHYADAYAFPLSPAAIALIARLLDRDPAKRPSYEAVLSDAWVLMRG